MIDSEFLLTALQMVSGALLAVSIWLSRNLWVKVEKLERDNNEARIITERTIADLRVETAERLASLEAKAK